MELQVQEDAKAGRRRKELETLTHALSGPCLGSREVAGLHGAGHSL